MMTIQYTALLWLALLPARAAEPSPVGHWQTVDDKTGAGRGTVRIYEEGGEIFARIASAAKPEENNEICDKCTDFRKNQPVIGMVIVRHMKWNGKEYDGGDILDPDTGTVYRCRMRLTGGGAKLQVRGFVGVSLFGRTQTWTRIAEPAR